MKFIATFSLALSISVAALVPGPGVAGEAGSFEVVDIRHETDPAILLAVRACAGLYNRKSGGSAYTLEKEKDEKWLDELGLVPRETTDPGGFLDACLAQFPRCVSYSYDGQRELMPNIVTVAAVLGAVPLDTGMPRQCGEVVFDATMEFKDLDTPYLATRYVYENYVDHTSGLAMLDPGYRTRGGKLWDPEIEKDMDTSMADFVFSEKLFTIYLVNGCIKGTRQHELLNEIAANNPWPEPIGVYGYASYWMVFGGYLFEAQTTCSDSRNMGAIPSKVGNLSFFSTRRKPVADPAELRHNEPEDIEYDPAKTYVAFIVGDGDNISFIMSARADWFRRRAEACAEGMCPTLTWSISPHLPRVAPDVLEWYYDMARETGKDYFALPPSGHLYAYPASLSEGAAQDKFAEATKADARVLGTKSVVHWEWFNKWCYAEREFLPKYAGHGGPVAGIFPVNVPYMFPTFTWRGHGTYKVLAGGGGRVALFRPKAWRGVDKSRGEFMDARFYLTPGEMAEELAGYPRGTVTAIYMTSDGGLNLDNSLHELVEILPEHVRLVSADTAARLALDASDFFERQ